MSEQFNWHVGEDEDNEMLEEVHVDSSRAVFPYLLVIGTAVALVLLIGSWQVGQKEVEQSEDTLQAEVQALLNFQHDAFLQGDGNLFFSGYYSDPAFRAAQLLPYNLEAHRAGLQITNVRQQDEFIWVNVSWEAENETYQRILFFTQRGDRLSQVASDEAFWGVWVVRELDWGTLGFFEIDRKWADAFETAVTPTIHTLCADGCSLPLTISIVDHYGETAVANQIRMPSPRLIGLDENGDPASQFWLTLEQKIADRLTPATIKFAIPPPVGQTKLFLLDYEQAARDFMALHPNIAVELTIMDTIPDDISRLATEFDGAAIVPTQDMLAAGLVFDLSDYIKSDPDFDQADFYEQVWQGALWQERVWIIPQAAQMHVLFYDRKAYQNAELPEPSLRLTWNELAHDISTLLPDANQDVMQWGYLDTGLDSLYSYAYNWNNQCTLAATILCQTPLRTQNVAAALEWYQQMVVHEQSMPNLVKDLPQLLSPVTLTFMNEEVLPYQLEEFLLSNFQSSRRTAAIWVDEPIAYEYQHLIFPLGVVPFPGSDRFDGITPLRVQGNFISQGSKRPFAVWQWIKFLSDQRPAPRYVPARPSVANQMGFWRSLPQPLGDVMRTAFPFARPITVEEQTAITWEQVTAVVSGELTPSQAANQRNDLFWFKDIR
ncbi:MAG: extracellular solute-binding protein [Chloroflexi bacterium]|nr:extracellular solute-binding protein [Chloroflexota bacterium]